MAEKKEKLVITDDIHKKLAVDAFNNTWALIDKKDRTQEEIDDMIHTAHASRYHWGKIGEPIHFERGEWQISRVYSLVNQPEAALYHAKRCLDICLENNIGDFDIAFAYEAMARANAVAGKTKEKDEFLQRAKEAAENIKKKDDKDYFLSELKSI
ncbi:MAG: hypothetical protein FK730_00720 [Asgard group archaeon]|nr:hypothetical protein [Asgard group archaeon]